MCIRDSARPGGRAAGRARLVRRAGVPGLRPRGRALRRERVRRGAAAGDGAGAGGVPDEEAVGLIRPASLMASVRRRFHRLSGGDRSVVVGESRPDSPLDCGPDGEGASPGLSILLNLSMLRLIARQA